MRYNCKVGPIVTRGAQRGLLTEDFAKVGRDRSDNALNDGVVTGTDQVHSREAMIEYMGQGFRHTTTILTLQGRDKSTTTGLYRVHWEEISTRFVHKAVLVGEELASEGEKGRVRMLADGVKSASLVNMVLQPQ